MVSIFEFDIWKVVVQGKSCDFRFVSSIIVSLKKGKGMDYSETFRVEISFLFVD